MKAWLDAWSGRVTEGEELARRTHAHYTEHGAFGDYNSPPTYFGIDLWALGLWRDSIGTNARARPGAGAVLVALTISCHTV
jgi:hypothetical protein